jgi:hypothetical protein
MTEGKLILGIMLIIVGIAIMLIPFFGWIYGPILIAIGIAFIILRDSDKKIEQRKDIKTKRN